MDIKNRFLRYVSIDTESDEENENQIPSTTGQWTLANMLVAELKELGVSDACTDEFGTVYAHIPATTGYEKCMAFGFIAHMDTVKPGKNIKPQVISNYDGKDILLSNGTVINAERFPELPGLIGREMIVTDGTTILGADDKAGIAAIMGMCELLTEKELQHGKICIAFTPDEETGNGVRKFALEKFGADYAVTVDGGAEYGVEYENFNAASVKIQIQGVPSHPGSAKGVMVNAVKIAYELHSMLPEKEAPEFTEEKEGFYHLMSVDGSMSQAKAEYIIREHDKDKYKQKKAFLEQVVQQLNEKYGEGTVNLTLVDSYQNMAEIIKLHPHLLSNIEKAIRNTGMEPEYFPIRGGTDGCRLTFMGLPCPNLGAGAYGFHGMQEHCTVEGMEISAQVLLELVKIYAGILKN